MMILAIANLIFVPFA